MMPGNKAPQNAATQSGEFFVPDLCSPRPLFIIVLLAELLVLVYALATSALPTFNWDLLATASLFVQWIVLLCAALLCRLRSVLAHWSLQFAALACLSVVLLVTGFSSVVALNVLPLVGIEEQGGWWLLRNLLVAMVLGGIVLRYFYLQQQLQLRERAELQARLDSLSARIRPHFLFNTMNSIASLIATRPQAAEQAVEDLSELFRASLREQQQGNTTVEDELRLCRLYLRIEELRLGNRLQVVWDVEPGSNERLMPALLLQPLMENAVYHGIAQLPSGGVITVKMRARGDKLEVRIENPMPAVPRPSGGHQMALNNIEQRLQGTYGSEASLQTEAVDGQFRLLLTYPPEYVA